MRRRWRRRQPVLRGPEPEPPGRDAQYLHAVAEAALGGLLTARRRARSIRRRRSRRCSGCTGSVRSPPSSFVVRGADAPDAVPLHERRLDDEVVTRSGGSATVESVSDARRPFRTSAAAHLRAGREARPDEFG